MNDDVMPRRRPARWQEHSELAHSWPAIVFGLAIAFAFVSAAGVEWARILAGVLVIATFVPCCLIRDWWVGR